MGWTYFQAPAGKRSLEILRGEWPSLRFIDAEQIGSTVYAAVSTSKAPADVFALVVLIDRRNGQFGYKDMDEGMGPYECQCPARILDKLSATANSYALEWRAKCREYHRDRVTRESTRAGFECTGTFDGFTCGSDADPGL
jgi:hypothetical protein